jgi:hypothetical protein
MAGVLPATLRVALRSKIAPGDFMNFRPLPPEGNARPNQAISKHIHECLSLQIKVQIGKALFVFAANICRISFLVAGDKSGYKSSRMPLDFGGFAWTSILTKSKCYEPKATDQHIICVLGQDSESHIKPIV